MADSIGFSGPGAPDLKNRNDSDDYPALPTFFVKGAYPEDELTPSTVETPREKAMRVDGQETSGNSAASAPKI